MKQLTLSKIFNKMVCINIKLINNTEASIAGLNIKYTDLKNPIEIPSIASNGVYKTKIELTELEDEGNMELYYLDKLGNEERIVIAGYIEGGYRGKVDITINSVDSNGKLNIEVKEDISIL